jgi:hypothetical protein
MTPMSADLPNLLEEGSRAQSSKSYVEFDQ